MPDRFRPALGLLLATLLAAPALAQATATIPISVHIRSRAAGGYEPSSELLLRGRVIGRDQGLFLVRITAGVVRVNAGAWHGPEPRDAEASLEIIAARHQENGRQTFLAREIRTASGTVVLRDTQGMPLPR